MIADEAGRLPGFDEGRQVSARDPELVAERTGHAAGRESPRVDVPTQGGRRESEGLSRVAET
jgi:hypothetical protein